MENKLRKLFDYQKFEKNDRLAAMIEETLQKYSPEDAENSNVVKFGAPKKATALSDDELFGVNAAMGTQETTTTVTSYCENCKKDTTFIVYSGTRAKCSICGTIKNL